MIKGYCLLKTCEKDTVVPAGRFSAGCTEIITRSRNRELHLQAAITCGLSTMLNRGKTWNLFSKRRPDFGLQAPPAVSTT